jgi:hypothetical protein
MATNDNKYIFRLQNPDGQANLKNTIKDWGESAMYGDREIGDIESSNSKSEHEPTSIPSPFARIALAKTAFGEVAEYGEKALASYQKIVSDCLDVAEIFFTFDKWQHKIEIIEWNKEKSLAALENHKILHKTLKTFLDNDAEIYNFGKMKSIYILKHKKTGKMIGATSPCTLFFSSANKLSDVKIPLSVDRNAFEGKKPLHERSWDFQKYLYTWFAANNETQQVEGKPVSIFDEVGKYLAAQMQESTNKGRNNDDFPTTDKLPENWASGYNQMRSPDVEICGKYCYYAETKASKEYLTADDLLEDTIIRMPLAIRSNSFFDGNLSDKDNTYLLPVKDEFFKHWDIDTLKKSIRINHYSQYATVTLNIEGKEYKKEYKVSENRIIELSSYFDCAIFPNVRFKNDKDAQYRFGLVCDFNEKEKYKAEFVKIDGTIDANAKRESVRNETFGNNKQLKNYSLEGSNFDYIKIAYNGVFGIVIPGLDSKEGSKEFTFAVDFGTTNTHIEYKVDTDREQKFDILPYSKDNKDECQVHCLHGRDSDLKYVFDYEFIPAYTDIEFKFPMRSALLLGENPNWSNIYPFEKASAAFLYEKKEYSPYFGEPITDLKWSDSADNKNQVKAYIESLMFILRNKVVIGGGDLSKTKIRWFYPVAMERGRYNNFDTAWKDAYKKYFGGADTNLVSITESVAPFEYYLKDGNSSNLVTIDIGGGTTDIVISSGNKTADYITSFRFAANSIFGDGYAENGRVKNGIVRQFAEKIKTELLTEFSENDELFRIFQNMQDNKDSSDIASFLFSLGSNKKVIAKGKNLSENANLTKKLMEEPKSHEIIFIFFYSAIIYHLAKLMKAKTLDMPDKIVFSGNGSRVISFFTTDIRLLTDYTKLIFTKIYGTNDYAQNGLKIILNTTEPKEATCKGGLLMDKPESYSDIYKKKVVLHSNGTNAVIQKTASLTELPKDEDKNKAIDADYLDKTVEEVKIFIQFVLDLLPFLAHNGYKLNSASVEIAQAECFKRLDIHAKNGWHLKKSKEKLTDDEQIEETLFFYPLVGMFKALSDAICNKNLEATK